MGKRKALRALSHTGVMYSRIFFFSFLSSSLLSHLARLLEAVADEARIGVLAHLVEHTLLLVPAEPQDTRQVRLHFLPAGCLRSGGRPLPIVGGRLLQRHDGGALVELFEHLLAACQVLDGHYVVDLFAFFLAPERVAFEEIHEVVHLVHS